METAKTRAIVAPRRVRTLETSWTEASVPDREKAVIPSSAGFY